MSKELLVFLENDEEKLVRILRLFQLISGVNKSIEASQKMDSNSMIKQFEYQKAKFIKELNEILSNHYKLELVMRN